MVAEEIKTKKANLIESPIYNYSLKIRFIATLIIIIIVLIVWYLLSDFENISLLETVFVFWIIFILVPIIILYAKRKAKKKQGESVFEFGENKKISLKYTLLLLVPSLIYIIYFILSHF